MRNQNGNTENTENERNPWSIWCQVSGGRTGSRQAWMKDADGNIWIGSQHAAEEKAAELNKLPAGGGARFSYTATEYSE